jgi:hypothetical protein
VAFGNYDGVPAGFVVSMSIALTKISDLVVHTKSHIDRAVSLEVRDCTEHRDIVSILNVSCDLASFDGIATTSSNFWNNSVLPLYGVIELSTPIMSLMQLL